jgi:multidrug efflux pump
MSDIKNQMEELPKKVDKEFKLTSYALRNKTTVYFLTFLVVVMGISSYISLPKDSYPEVKQPIIYIGTAYPGNSPLDMENLVTRPIEKELNSISEIEKINSTSVQDYSTIIIEFDPKTSVEEALSKVKDAVDRAKPELPNDLPADPNAFELNFSEFPIMNINLSGNYSLDELNKYAEYLEDEIEKIREVSKVDIRGVDEKEVRINADPYQMEARHISFSDIANAINAENVTLSGGNVLDDGVRRTIRVLGEFEDPRQLLDVVVKHEKGNIAYLRDVATVEFTYKDKTSYARLNGEPVVMVDIIKRSGENLIEATKKIQLVLAKAKAEVLPDDLNVTITNDQSEFTIENVASLENNIISGVILVVLVLLFFLGTRNALFAGMAIPLSMFLSFVILGAFGITINMMVLFGLIMALGMLVDNGIVVVENVYRLMEEGYSPIDATKLGVGEVAWPIIASTATTLAAFLPLAMWPGIMGEFMKYLPITLIVALSSSLFVALVINPIFIATFMRVGNDGVQVNYQKIWKMVGVFLIVGAALLLLKVMVIGNLLIVYALLTLLNIYVFVPLSKKFQRGFLPIIERMYASTISVALRGKNPYLFFFGTIGMMVLSISLFIVRSPEIIYFPINEPKYANVFIEFPVGTDIEITNEFTLAMEEKVMALVKPHQDIVESVTANVGQGTSDPNDPSGIGQSDTPHKARITVNFVEYKKRGGKNTQDVLDEMRLAVQGYPGVTVTVDKDAAGPPAGKPISIELSGDDLATLMRLGEQLKNFINESGIPGIEKLKTDLEIGKPELIVDIDREKARRFGLSTYMVADEVRTSLFGKEVSKFKQGEDDYEIQLRLDEKYRYDVDALLNKSITFRDQSTGRIVQVPISSIARAELSSTYGSIKRKDLKRVINLSSNVLTGYNPTKITGQIKELLEDFNMPPGYSYKFTGEQEQQAEQFEFLFGALLLAIGIIFFIIVAQFNKITTPIIIMTTVPLSTIGVFLGLVIFNMNFVVIMTMVGIISLAGVVVNNAIVLLDFIELKRKRMREEQGVDRLEMPDVIFAIKEAGKTRLRPVLLTAITTVLGLIPLAIGINIDFVGLLQNYNPDFYVGGDSVIFWSPLSWTIIFGLIFATFLTLVIVPVMYLFFARINRWLNIA